MKMDTIYDRQLGCFMGLAVGDAVGTTLEFRIRDSYKHITDMTGGGPFNLAPGEWTDDTSMALGLADAIVSNGMDQLAILRNFTDWYQNGKFSHNGKCFDIGIATENALLVFINSGYVNPVCGNPDTRNSGNGGIMRLAPAAIFAKSAEQAIDYGISQSVTTHSSPLCVDIAGRLGNILWQLMETGKCKFEDNYLTLPRDQISSSGYVLSTFDAAIWCFVQTDNFRDCVLLAANLGDDADTVAAVAGQIAGAAYGYNAIPTDWIEKLVWHNKIKDYTDKILDRRKR